jgi:hypothetical protein
MLLISIAPLLADSSASDPLLPSQATVVLLSGLPGDAASEKTYHDQLEAWLEVIARSSQASTVFILCDSPDAFAASRKSTIEPLLADRRHFAALGKELAGTTNPLVFIAWGHGGKQRTSPVFHVRGPRLTPKDFVDLAAQAQTVVSHWILLFRGSGAFASELAGERRQILSSDCERMFGDDPVEMALLLKVVRSDPGVAFGRMAEELGAATATWYSERNLARTEEPTLWLGGKKPRRLIMPASGEHELASVERTEGTDPVDGQKPKAVEPSEVAGASRELPAVWNEVKKVKLEDYPDADGVILSRKLKCVLAVNPAITTEQDEFVQILKPEGKQLGDFDVTYSPPEEELEFLDCEVLGPDGKLVRLDPEVIANAGERSPGDYQVNRRKFFSLPGVIPGAVLHVRYRTEWKRFPLPCISMDLPLEQELPAVESVVEVSLPKGTPFHFAFQNVSAPEPETRQTSYSTFLSWRFANLIPRRHEMLAPPHQSARLMLSTFPDWASLAEWYGRISKLADEITPEIAAKAKELTETLSTDKQKVLAVYNYVTGLRYVAIPLGINSFRPHAAGNVLKNQFGDCKDKANLFNALLHAASIEAHLALVPRFSEVCEGIPGLAFNHAISRVRLEDETFWLDTTDEICRFGLLPPGDPGRKVLVIDGKTTTLTQLPTSGPGEHRLKIRGQLGPGNADGTWPAKLSAVGFGYPDYALRMVAREAKEHRAGRTLLAGRFRPVAGSFALEEQTHTEVSSLGEEFAWQANGACVGLGSTADGKWTLHSPFWVPKEWDLALNRRRSALFLNEGYPFTLDEEFEFELHSKPQSAVLPQISQNTSEPLRWHIEWARIADDKLAARFHTELVRGDLSEAETPVLQQQLRSLLTAMGLDASLSLSPPK